MSVINREDAMEAFGLSEKTRKYGGDHSGYDTMLKYEIQDVLENLPSAEVVHIEAYRELYEKYVNLKHALAEAVHVIRCKDCKYGVQDEYGRWSCHDLGCQMGDGDGNGFCSDGERKEK